MRFVLDNSVAMRWLFADSRQADQRYARRVLEQLSSPDCQAIAPAVWPLEVANVISRAEHNGQLREARSAKFLGILDSLGIDIDPRTSGRALSHTLDLARRYRLSAYDASYLDMALHNDAPLATLDAGLRKAAEKAGVAIFLGD